MTFKRLSTALFSDRGLIAKLVIAAVITGITLIFTPLLVGLIGWAVLFGYQVETIRRARDGALTPLAAWVDFERLFQRGWRPLFAWLILQIPLFTLAFLQATLGGISGWFGATVSFAVLCLSLPVGIIYVSIIYPIFTLNLGRYTETGRFATLLQFQPAWGLLGEHRPAYLTYVMMIVLVGLGLAALYAIPCIGWIAALALTVPLSGLVGALYAAAVLGRPSPMPPAPTASAVPEPPW
jgi:hypothetical protein